MEGFNFQPYTLQKTSEPSVRSPHHEGARILGGAFQLQNVEQQIHVSRQTETRDNFDCYANAMSRIKDDLAMLNDIQKRLNHASVKSHMLTVDAVTMFNPEVQDKLNKCKEECEDCIQKMKTLSEK